MHKSHDAYDWFCVCLTDRVEGRQPSSLCWVIMLLGNRISSLSSNPAQPVGVNSTRVMTEERLLLKICCVHPRCGLTPAGMNSSVVLTAEGM